MQASPGPDLTAAPADRVGEDGSPPAALSVAAFAGPTGASARRHRLELGFCEA